MKITVFAIDPETEEEHAYFNEEYGEDDRTLEDESFLEELSERWEEEGFTLFCMVDGDVCEVMVTEYDCVEQNPCKFLPKLLKELEMAVEEYLEG